MYDSLLAAVLRVSAGMLHKGTPPNHWLAASAALGHQQVAGSVSQCCQGVTACHRQAVRALAQHPSTRLQVLSLHGCSTSAGTAGAAWRPAASAGTHTKRAAAVVCSAAAGSFRLPGVSSCPPHSTHQGMAHARHMSAVPALQRSQQQPQPSKLAVAADDAGRSLLVQSWHKKRPADMNNYERLACLQERLLQDFDWDLQELATLSFQGHNTTFRSTCPECQNGSRNEDCFAVTVSADDSGRPAAVLFCCHRANCGFHGGVSLHGKLEAGGLQPSQPASGSWAPLLPLPPSRQQQWMAQPPPAQQQQQQQAQPAGQPVPTWSQQPQQQPWWLQQQVQPSPAGAPAPLATPSATAPPRQLGTAFQELSPELLQWLQEERGLSAATLARHNISMEHRFCSALGEKVDHIAFPYLRDGAIVNVKYRALPKHFTQVKGGQQILYGYDDARGADDIIIVEGELDKLAVEEALMQVAAAGTAAASSTAAAAAAAGSSPAEATAAVALADFMAGPDGSRRAVVSVPSGAPSRVTGASTNQQRKFKFVDDCRDVLAAAKRFVLAVDTDGPGLALAAELVRRLGPEKCLTVKWPRKDASEVLLLDGPEVLKSCIDAAEPVPVRGLFHFDAFRKEVWLLYSQGIRGLGMGFSTGWASVDQHYRVVPGELTIVTGLSNSGKSEWLDALTVNLAEQHGWRFAVCSLENSPVEHGRKLMEKYIRKALVNAQYAQTAIKMNYEDVRDGIVWIDEHFHLIQPPPDGMPHIDYILDKARAAVLRYGIKGLIVDPYNELDTRRGRDMSETEYVSCMLSKVKRFAQHYECHVWFVAHPRTQRGLGVGGGSSTLSAPSMYDISGSAHFINKADNGIVIHRPHTGRMTAAEGEDPRVTQVLVRKVRNKVAGSIGDITLLYDKPTGRYDDS